MKILQAVPWYFPDSTGGTEVYVRALVAGLQQHGHEVVVALPSPEPGESTYMDTRVIRYESPRLMARARALEVDGGADEAFLRVLHDIGPDVAHFHTLTTGLGVREVEAAKDRGIATVFTSHSSSLGYLCARGTLLQWGTDVCDGVRTVHTCSACVLQSRGVPRLSAHAVAAVARLPLSPTAGRVHAALQATTVSAWNRERHARLVAAADRFVVLTQFAADAVIARGAPRERVVVNRLGTRTPPTQWSAARVQRDPHAPVRIGYLGRFDPIKGVEVLARAAASLPRDAAIEIEMRGPVESDGERGTHDTVVSLLGDDPRFKVGGPLATDDAFAFLASLDYLCCPSLCAEGGPTVALEANAVGTPVIGSRIGGLGEIVRDDVDGALVEPARVDALASALLRVERDRSLRARWSNAIRPVRTMSHVVDDYLDLYGSLCSHASAL